MYRLVLKESFKRAIQRTIQNGSRRQINSSSNGFPRQAGFGKFIIILTPFAVTGGVVAYAKYDNEFRQSMVRTVPGSEAVLKVLLQEENPFKDLISKFEELTAYLTGFFSSGDSKKDTPTVILKKPEIIEKEKSSPFAKATPTPQSHPLKLSPPAPQKLNETAKQAEVVPTDIGGLEKGIESAAALAVSEFNKAIKILKVYNDDVRRVVDEAVEKSDLNSWNILKNKTGARDSAVENAENVARDALSRIEKFEVALSKVVDSVNQDRLLSVRKKILTLTDHINGVKDELYKHKDCATLSEKYWKRVENARNYYVDEIESIFPGLVLNDKKLNLSKEDLDLFLIHAYSHVLSYQKELERIQLDGELKLKRAIEALRADDSSEAIKTQLEYHLDKEKRNLAFENQKKIFLIRNQVEKELRQQLKRQSEAHVDHLQDALSQKEQELKRSFTRELDEKLSAEKAAYKLELATMLGKLKGMDAALKARAESERCAHQAQALWAACQALWASVRNGEPGVHWRNKLRPLRTELKAVGNAAAKGDELVAIILDNLPPEAMDRGVYPEDALRERFFNVEKTARRVAIVPEEGANLPMYILSYIQSVFIMRPDNPISDEEIHNKKYDFSKLDTYDILNRARYYLDRGDLTQTLKYMNLLQGAARKVSIDWMKEARMLLETQQAANTLMAHAAASGLLYL